MKISSTPVRAVIAVAVVLVLAATSFLVGRWSASGEGSGQDETTTAAPADGAEGAATECGDGSEPLSQTLSSGATWSLCWEVDPDLGMVLSDIFITPPGADPISLIDTLSISQLEVPYDDGGRTTYDITEAGFGGSKMKTIDSEVCAGDIHSFEIPNVGDGTYGKTEDRDVLCSSIIDGGVAYHASGVQAPAAARRTDWQLFTVSRVGWYEYLTEYTFAADGTIDIQLGATGDLSPVDYSDEQHGSDVGDDEHATSHSHNAVWRVDWALGGDDGMAVQQYDATPTEEMGEESPVLEGTLTDITHPATASWKDRRWWRVLNPSVTNDDGRPISYQIDNSGTDSFTFTDDQEQDGDHVHEGDAGYDVAFTNVDDCQIFAVKNRGGCGRSVPDFVERGKDEALSDVVSWVAVGFHHVPRDEEQSPMEAHWQGFQLVPRDLTAQRFDVPEGREDVNGRPDDEWYEEPV